MALGGVNGFETAAPLVPQWFTGYRSWDVRCGDDGTYYLQSVTFNYKWVPGINTATCLTKPGIRDGCRDALHPDGYAHVPECYEDRTCAGVTLNCGCGFWNYDTPTHWFKQGGGFGHYSIGGRPWVSGIVHGFGRMVVGTDGFRAGKAVIAALVMPAHVSHASIPMDIPAGTTREELDVMRATEAAAVRERVEDGLREQYPAVPFFRSVEAALAAVPLTPMAEFIATLKDGEAAA